MHRAGHRALHKYRPRREAVRGTVTAVACPHNVLRFSHPPPPPSRTAPGDRRGICPPRDRAAQQSGRRDRAAREARSQASGASARRLREMIKRGRPALEGNEQTNHPSRDSTKPGPERGTAPCPALVPLPLWRGGMGTGGGECVSDARLLLTPTLAAPAGTGGTGRASVPIEKFACVSGNPTRHGRACPGHPRVRPASDGFS